MHTKIGILEGLSQCYKLTLKQIVVDLLIYRCMYAENLQRTIIISILLHDSIYVFLLVC
jgi:hypothetical protein